MALKFILTEKIVEDAIDYIPTVIKETFCESVYDKCIRGINSSIEGDSGEKTAMPPYYCENTERKQRYLMGALIKLYLKIDYNPTEDGYLMDAFDYDTYAGSHIFNQLERMKNKGSEVREKIFNILYDYRDLERRLNNKVHSLIKLQNDPVTRIILAGKTLLSSEMMKNTQEEFERLQAQLQDQVDKSEKKSKKTAGTSKKKKEEKSE